MVRVTPIKLQAGTKVLWFDPAEHNVCAGDHVIVSTERGSEFGVATADIMEVSDEMIAQLKSPLKPVLRIADEQDIERAHELQQKGEEALATFKELAAETSEQMRPVMVEFLFDGDKAVFYFESEERIDFRDLVRKLAGVFHVRVDMRQIGVRDGARMIGGIGHCGQELCCARMGGEFSPVSIRMAKEQNLSLNPQKISGCCGRLMCCLRYEYEAYKEVNARAPKNGAKIEIPDGFAKVTEINVPLERITLQLEDGKTFKVPLAEMEIAGEGKRPNRISEEVFEKYASADPFALFNSSSATSDLEVSSFTIEDKLANPNARPLEQLTAQSAKEDAHRKPRRRRRSVDVSADGTVEVHELTQKEAKEDFSSGAKHEQSARQKHDEETSRRRRDSRRDRKDQKGRKSDFSKQAQSESSDSSKATSRRQRRGGGLRRQDKQQPKHNDTRNQTREKRDRTNRSERTDHIDRVAPHEHTERVEHINRSDRSNRVVREESQRSRRRPGQKSSGVRNAPAKMRQQDRSAKQIAQRNRSTSSGQGTATNTHRKPRRRHRKAGGETNAE